MARQYHYLIAGLPELAMADKKLPTGVADFRDKLDEELHPSDRELIKIWFLPYDHANIANALYHTHKPFDYRGTFAPFEIERMTDKRAMEDETAHLPFGYIRQALDDAMTADEQIPAAKFEWMLHNGYCQMMRNHPNAFVRQLASFDIDQRNAMAAMNGRKFNLPFEDQLMGEGDVTDAFKKSRARDFGLSADIAQMDTLVQIFDTEDLLERELKLDQLRWQFIDDAVFFHYFTIERIVAFLLKLMIVDRWMSLDEDKGRELFRQLIHNLQSGYKKSEENKLSHGNKQ